MLFFSGVLLLATLREQMVAHVASSMILYASGVTSASSAPPAPPAGCTRETKDTEDPDPDPDPVAGAPGANTSRGWDGRDGTLPLKEGSLVGTTSCCCR